MRKTSIALLLCIVHCALCIPFNALCICPAISQIREQMGGIYFAYPDSLAENSILPQPPAGYEPVYISHYGRHGSRWPVNPKAYKLASDLFQEQHMAQNLTPEGRAAWKLVTLCAGDANGHLGELTSLGEQQHRDIARRMAKRFPTLFAEGSRIEARSSIQPRCIMSMAAATDELRLINPRLDIRRHATPGDMDFIHHQTEESELMNSDLAPWRWEFNPMRDSISVANGVIAKLFKSHPDSVRASSPLPVDDPVSIPAFCRALFDIAISVQNIPELDADLFSLFSDEELKNLWTAANYIQYVGNGNSPLTGGIGPDCARPLLKEIAERADSMLASGKVPVDLRFGHDTDLLRLVSLLGIDGYDIETEDMHRAAALWPNYRIAPMAGNLQLVFYRNEEGDVIFLPLLNELPAKLKTGGEINTHFYPLSGLK